MKIGLEPILRAPNRMCLCPCATSYTISQLWRHLLEHLLFPSQEHLLTSTCWWPVQTFFWLTFFGQAHAIVIFNFQSDFSIPERIRTSSVTSAKLSAIHHTPGTSSRHAKIWTRTNRFGDCHATVTLRTYLYSKESLMEPDSIPSCQCFFKWQLEQRTSHFFISFLIISSL